MRLHICVIQYIQGESEKQNIFEFKDTEMCVEHDIDMISNVFNILTFNVN